MNVTDCIVWHKCIAKDGYGVTWFRGKKHPAHRVAYIKAHGEIPEGLVVRHTCDNRSCVNPEHLIIGTQKDNIRDMFERGRQHDRSGENSAMSKLTASQVEAIRLDQRKQKDIALEYGINQSAVSRIKSNKRWR